jgi:hypothetical protein
MLVKQNCCVEYDVINYDKGAECETQFFMKSSAIFMTILSELT